jgi:hypothetical protein
MHRVGPHRLHVRLARELGQVGFTSLRVDLAGRGDSAPRADFMNHHSVAADFAEILSVLDSRLGRSPIILGGLCSGADNAIMLTLNDPRVVGMVLLDPICFPDNGLWGFRTREIAAKYTNVAEFIAWLKRRLKVLARPGTNNQRHDTSVDPPALWNPPTRIQLQAAFESIRERKGRVLSVFTGVARDYNQTGQLCRVLGLPDYGRFCTELFWPGTDHTFSLEVNRRRLIHAIKTWARDSFAPEAPGTDGSADRTPGSLPSKLRERWSVGRQNA